MKTAARLRRAAPNVFASGRLQFIPGEHEAFDALAADESVHDLGYVRDGDVSIKEMIRLDQNDDASRRYRATCITHAS